MRHRPGFTFIEVICILLVVSFGLLGVIGLVSYGMSIAAKTQGSTTGLSTAVSVAMDPRPFVPQVLASDWDYTPYDMDGSGALTSTAKGYINGFWVERTETSTDADVIARSGSVVHARAATVSVDVFETFRGNAVAAYTTQIVRQRGAP